MPEYNPFKLVSLEGGKLKHKQPLKVTSHSHKKHTTHKRSRSLSKKKSHNKKVSHHHRKLSHHHKKSSDKKH